MGSSVNTLAASNWKTTFLTVPYVQRMKKTHPTNKSNPKRTSHLCEEKLQSPQERDSRGWD